MPLMTVDITSANATTTDALCMCSHDGTKEWTSNCHLGGADGNNERELEGLPGLSTTPRMGTKNAILRASRMPTAASRRTPGSQCSQYGSPKPSNRKKR